MAEFQANALSLVGNFSGPCIIYLNGEAITVKQGNGVEIAKWPYNCIRQFKAEDESGKFSFVSGRRGPYGVAEYNFGLDDVSQLQNALSQFTGAQFSQTQSSQPPLPPIPQGQRPPSLSSSGRFNMGSRTDSVESVFLSSSHTRINAPYTPAPKLPPRDYLHSAGSGSSISDAFQSIGGYAFARTRNSVSASDILDSGFPPTISSSSHPQSNQSSVPQPSLGGGPYISSNEPYHFQGGGPTKPDGGSLGWGRKPSPGSQKRSPLTQAASSELRDEVPDLPPRESLTRPKTNSTGSMPQPTASSADSKQLKKQHTEPALSQKPALAPKPPIVAKKPSKKQHPPQSPSPEHLNKDAIIEGGSTGVSPEPQPATSGTTSPVPDSSDLDYIPRSSPQVTRSLRSTLKGRLSPQGNRLVKSTTTPALHSETYDVPKSLKTQLSTEARIGEVPKSLKTQLNTEARIGDELYNNVSISGEAPKQETTYQVPRPTIDSEYHVPRPEDDVMNEKQYYHRPTPADEVYKVPRPMSGTYSSLLLGHVSSNSVYSSPRPPVGKQSPQGVYYSYPPDADGSVDTTSVEDGSHMSVTAQNGGDPSAQLYGNVSQSASSGAGGGDSEENFYNVPRPGAELDSQEHKEEVVTAATGDNALYNVPRSLGSQQEANNGFSAANNEGLYKVPRTSSGGSSDHQMDDGLYKIPRSVKQSGSASPPPRNPYETVDLDQPRGLRPAKSDESLHRINTLPPRRVGNRYVGINVDNPSSSGSAGRPFPSRDPGWIQKQPLPPRPKQDPAADNLYSEIPEDLLAKRRMANGRWSPPARGERSSDNLYVTGPEVASAGSAPQPNRSTSPYDKLPPRRPTPEFIASEGVAKAKELAKQGYELCLPSGEDLRMTSRTSSIATPPRNIPRKNFSSLEKYDIKTPGELSFRPHRTASGSTAGPLTPGPSEAVLGSSNPSDSTQLTTDEYVIITRPDTRPKHPQTLPRSSSSSMTSSDTTVFPDGDEYEQMNPVKSQILLSQSSHYSTPNPSLHGNGGETTTTSQVAVTTTVTGATETVGGASIHLYGNTEHMDKDFSNLDRAVRTGETMLVRAQTLPPRSKTISSSRADSNVFPTSLSSTVSGPMSIPEDQRRLVPIASGSPANSESSLPRLRSYSDDNYLENGTEKPKRHSYVNVPGDGTEVNEQTKLAAESAVELSQPGPPKKPKPFPRSTPLTEEKK